MHRGAEDSGGEDMDYEEALAEAEAERDLEDNADARWRAVGSARRAGGAVGSARRAGGAVGSAARWRGCWECAAR